MSYLSEITAPYNFVPLSGWIYRPKWGEDVSHDVPFDDGLSGVLDVTVKSHTRLLIGQQQVAATKQSPGEVRFFKDGDDFAIPGSSLKGMIRNVLEIAAFGKMRMVDGDRLGIRDITGGGHLKDIYASRMQDQKAGFLRLVKNDHDLGWVAELVPCKFAHITHDDLKKSIGHSSCLFQRGLNVQQKYSRWANLSKTEFTKGNLPTRRFHTQKQASQQHITLAKPSEKGGLEGQLVFTGQISDKCSGNGSRINKYGKYRDFIFYTNDGEQPEPLEVTAEKLADFRHIHGDGDAKHDGSWNNYWKRRFEQGYSIPVFYHTSGSKIRSMGLAFMYKLAYTYNIAETIAHTHPLHKNADLYSNDPYDLAEILFGKVDKDESTNNRSLKSRVSFGLCRCTDNPTPLREDPTILNGPKATYFPNYLQQDTVEKGRLESKKPYTTYMDDDAEVRGWKRYPVRPANKVKTQQLEGKQKDNSAVQVILKPLPKGTSFTGKIRFHNLKPAELGALLWSIQWGGDSELRHSLGMGKPFGYGQVSIELSRAEVLHNALLKDDKTRNDALKIYSDDALSTLTDARIQDFESEVEAAYTEKAKGNESWKDSVQMKNLLAMANPNSPMANKLEHMTMGMSIKNNEFVQAKKQGLTLADYANLDHTIDKEIFPRKSIVELAELERKLLDEPKRIQRELEDAKEKERLDALGPVERGIEEVLADNKGGGKKHTLLIKGLEAGKWEKEDEKKVAEYIRDLMQQENLWKETSAKKKPERDKPHQVTLKVIDYLKG